MDFIEIDVSKRQQYRAWNEWIIQLILSPIDELHGGICLFLRLLTRDHFVETTVCLIPREITVKPQKTLILCDSPTRVTVFRPEKLGAPS